MSALPAPPGEPGRDLLEQPAVAVRVAERRVREYERPGKSGKPGGFGCSSTSLTSTPRLIRSSRAASMSLTARYNLSRDPGSIAVKPFPKWIEHWEWGGVICTNRTSSP